MGDRVIELEVDPPDPPRRQPIAARWLVLSLAGLAAVAAVAIIAGRAQQPKPPAPRTYVSSPGFSLYTADNGDALFQIVIHSYSGNPIRLSKPTVVTTGGVEDVRLILTPGVSAVLTPGSDSPWPLRPVGVTSVVVPAQGEASLWVAYHVGCGSYGRKGPFVTAAHIIATAGSIRTSRNILPVLNPVAVYGKPYCPGR